MLRGLVVAVLLIAAASVDAAVTLLPGSSPQTARAFVPFANPVVVRVTNDDGTPAAGADVSLSGPPALTPIVAVDSSAPCGYDLAYVCTVKSGADGVARFPALMGAFSGTYSSPITAYLGSRSLGRTDAVFTVLALRPPAVITIVSGGSQSTVIGTAFPQPIVVRLTVNGSTVPFAELFLSPMSGGPGGFQIPLGSSSVKTDAFGMATLPPFIASWGVGTTQATIGYLDFGSPAWVTATAQLVSSNADGGLSLSFQDLWWSGPLENGWGMSVVQHRDQLMNVLFVYDAAGKPTWYVQPGGTWYGLMGVLFLSPIYSPRGSPWFAYDAARFTPGAAIGQIQLDFQGPTAGDIGVSINAGRDSSSTLKNIVRQDFHRSTPSPLQGVGDMWWGGPAQDGWGVVILEQPGGLFAVWFTYDEAGLPTWFVMPGGTWADGATYTGTIYRTSGSSWTGLSYDASRLQATPLGPYTLRFAGTNAATLQYSIEGRSGVLQLQRQPF